MICILKLIVIVNSPSRLFSWGEGPQIAMECSLAGPDRNRKKNSSSRSLSESERERVFAASPIPSERDRLTI